MCVGPDRLLLRGQGKFDAIGRLAELGDISVAARLLWGFCFSILRLGAVLAAIDEAGARAGRLLGETRAIWGIGYLAGALYAPVAVETVGWPVAITSYQVSESE